MFKKNIVMFWYMNDWGFYGRAYEQIATTLASHNTISHVTCILPPIKSEHEKNFFDKNIISNKLTVITPYWVSINKTGKFFRLRQFINKKLQPIFFIKVYLKYKGYRKKNTILWIFPPHSYLYTLAKEIPHYYLITQIVDNNTTRDIDGDTSEKINSIYNEFTSASNLVITSSELNYNLFNKKNINCILVENGVSKDFIAQPTELPYKITERRPRLGYVGFISQRTDLELLEYVAKNCENCDLIIAGPNEGPLSKSNILDYQNVVYLGPIPNTEVASLLQSFDICLIPHKKTPYSDSMSPLKLYQYLASGRPIVSTPVAGTEKFTKLIAVSSSYENFVQLINETLANDDIDKAHLRIERAKQESWEFRVELMLNKVMNQYI